MSEIKSSKFSIPEILKNDTAAAATISKLNTSKNRSYNTSKIKTKEISNSIKDKLKNNEDIVELFPDIELAIQILTSSVLAPSNMIDVNLQYEAPNIKIPAGTKRAALDLIKEYINETYSVENKLGTIFREAYFTKGVYSEIIIPESSLDDIIHGKFNDMQSGEVSIESVSEFIAEHDTGLKLLGGDIEKLSTESLIDINGSSEKIAIEFKGEDLDIDITENYNVLFAKKEFLKKVEKSIKKGLNHTISNESLDNLFMINKDDDKAVDFISVHSESESSRVSLDKPLVMKINPESIIPVHIKNDPSTHLGYFIIIDERGTPVNSDDFGMNTEEYVRDMIKNSKSAMIKKAKDALYGITKKEPMLEDISDIYNVIVNNMIQKKIDSGLYSGLVEIKENADIYRIMFMRTLEHKKTKLLFLPKELVAYFAFDYRENGTGKSMLEKVALLFSMRAVLLFSKIMANIKNSVSVTNVEATLDEDDTDPEGTKELIISEAIKSRQAMLPLGITNVGDLVSWAHKIGYRFNIAHPDLPNITINTSEESTSKAIPESDLDVEIQEWIIMSFGLNADMVKAGYEPEFASTFLAKNLLLSKRVINLQNLFNPMISNYFNKLLASDPIIKNSIRKLFKADIKQIKRAIKKSLNKNAELDKLLKNEEEILDYLVNKYVTGITVELAKPEVVEFTDDKVAFDNRKDMIDDYVDLIFSSDALPTELIGDVSDDIDNIKIIFKTMLIKKWANDNGYLPDVTEFLSTDEDGNPIFNLLDEYDSYKDDIGKVILPFLKRNKKTTEKLDKAKEKLDNGESDDDTEGDDTTSGAEGDDVTSGDGGDTGSNPTSEGGDAATSDDTTGDAATSDDTTGDDTTGGDTTGDDTSGVDV